MDWWPIQWKSELAQAADLTPQENTTENNASLIEEKQKTLESLEQKARNYQRLIDLKRKQQNTLKNQMELMNVRLNSLQNSIEITQKKIAHNQEEVNKIQRRINAIEKRVADSKKQLAEMLRAYNQIEREIFLEMLAEKNNFSSVLNQAEYLSQASLKIEDALRKIRQEKDKLTQEQALLQQEKDKLDQQKKKLQEESYYLISEKNAKNLILEKTKGEEQKYQVLLSRVEEQKRQIMGDLDDLSQEKRGELANIQAEAPKPKKNLASTSWYYSQKDRRWGYNRIGLSSSLIKDYGCALTALAMVFTYHGKTITPGQLASQPIFYRDLIVWPKYWKGLKLISSTAHGEVSWSAIDKQLNKKRPVIVFVRAAGGKGHYVVIHGKDKGGYIVHDPLFGSNIYLKTTQKLVGAVYNSSTRIDQAIVYQK